RIPARMSARAVAVGRPRGDAAWLTDTATNSRPHRSNSPYCFLGRLAHGRKARAAALPLDLALPLAARAALDVVPAVRHLLEAGDAVGRMRGDGGGQLQRRLLGAGGRGAPVDQA